MATAGTPEPGDVYAHERTFTRADVARFDDVLGDGRPTHAEPDADGTLVVPRLLTATLPTTIGGDLECLASEMDLRFLEPVHTGETITCEWRTETVTEREDRYELTASVDCTNEDGAMVVAGRIEGLVWKDGAGL